MHTQNRGTRVIYLHGFASGPGSNKAGFFANRLRGLAIPDLAAGDFERLTITGQLGIIDQAVAGQPVALIGSSLGGYLAALYASSHPEVAKLVLLAPAFGFARRWAASPEAAEWRRTGSLEIYHYGEKRQRSLGYQLIEDALRYPDFPDFHQPALLFHGSRDAVVPAKLSSEFAVTHPNAKLKVVDSDHELLDVLEPIWRQVEPFLVG
jgi:pimeloyl-ACP methyl ester carboxylesterase